MFKLFKRIGLALGALILTCIAGWITHCVWWVNLVMNNQLDTVQEGFIAALGTLFPPVGVIHGFIIWFT